MSEEYDDYDDIYYEDDQREFEEERTEENLFSLASLADFSTGCSNSFRR